MGNNKTELENRLSFVVNCVRGLSVSLFQVHLSSVIEPGMATERVIRSRTGIETETETVRDRFRTADP